VNKIQLDKSRFITA